MNENRTRKMILVVEDSKLLRTIAVDTLKTEGFGIYEAGNGRDGLRSALGVHPDIILLDIIMPIMDGLSMLKSLREDEWGKSVPVILLTGEEEGSFELPPNDPATSFVKKGDTMMTEVITQIKSRFGISN